MAITSTNVNRILSLFGDSNDNTIGIRRDAAGNILANNGAVALPGSPTVGNIDVIKVFGAGGNDNLFVDEVNGALPKAQLFGGGGNDVLTGGSGADLLFGATGDDVLLGKGGNDQLFGGAGNDTLTGGAGDDQLFGGGGDDRIIWNPGDGSDLAEGGSGIDTLEVNAGNAAETFTITPNGARVRFDRVTPAPFSIDAGTIENIVLNANGGDDVITASNGLAGLVNLTIDGGTGNDTITGGDGADRLFGGDGNDVITGGRGNDVASLGAGDDTFVWNPGDGSDTVEGEAGMDTLQFNGANVNEKIDISANGGRVRFFRDVGNVTMDLNGVETINFAALGGTDNIVVGDLSGTDAKQVNIDLAGTPGGSAGDGQADTVTINGTNGNDSISLSLQNGALVVDGLAEQVVIKNFDAATDKIVINGLGGDDVIDASRLGGGGPMLTLDGGDGDDVLLGGASPATLLGGAGDDVLIGGGHDILDGGPGDNIVLQRTAPAVAATSLSKAGPEVATGGTISGDQNLEIPGTSAAAITFAPGASGTLTLDHSTQFTGKVSGFAATDALDLKDIAFRAQMTVGYSGNSTGGVLSVSDGGNSAQIALLGNYMASSFVAASDGHGGTQITDPQTSQTLLLAQPHAA